MKFVFVLFVVSTTGYVQQSKPIVVQNAYFPKIGKEKEVYEWRLHASEVREKLGLPKGRSCAEFPKATVHMLSGSVDTAQWKNANRILRSSISQA